MYDRFYKSQTVPNIITFWTDQGSRREIYEKKTFGVHSIPSINTITITTSS